MPMQKNGIGEDIDKKSTTRKRIEQALLKVWGVSIS